MSQGNSKVDGTEKQAAPLKEPEQVMALVTGYPSPNSLASATIHHRKKKMLRNAAMRKEKQAGIKGG